MLLFTRKTNHTANVVLAAAMLALSLDVFNSAYIIFEYYREFPHFTGLTYAFPFLYGPIFYLYAKLISTDDNFRKGYYIHFIPFILVVIYGFVFVYFKSAEFKLLLIHNELGEPLPALEFISYMKPVHGLIYVYLTLRAVRAYNEKIRISYSNVERINLNWLRHLAAGLSVVWGVVIISYIVNILYDKNIAMDHLIYIAASVLIYSIGYLSLRQPQIFDKVIQKSETDLSAVKLKQSDGGISYQKSGLSEEEAKSYLNKLLQVMDKEKPYLKSDLTLRDLAGQLSMSAHNLSEILNTRINLNFYDFINRYRVEEVKRRLAEEGSEKFSIIAIAFDAGFNSKSAFNTIFKKHTNLTPSQYRKETAEKSLA